MRKYNTKRSYLALLEVVKKYSAVNVAWFDKNNLLPQRAEMSYYDGSCHRTKRLAVKTLRMLEADKAICHKQPIQANANSSIIGYKWLVCHPDYCFCEIERQKTQ